MEGRLYRIMLDVLSPVGRYLMTQPVGDRVAGPTFEIYEFEDGAAVDQLAELGTNAARSHPSLQAVACSVASL